MNEALLASMSRKGLPYENAVVESFFSSLKQELAYHEPFADFDTAKTRSFATWRCPITASGCTIALVIAHRTMMSAITRWLN